MNTIVGSLHLAISLFALWLLYFVGWREYRVDKFRQRVFEARDELFDFAAEGGIAFDDEAYLTLRNLANGFIRYAHRLTFTRVLILIACDSRPTTHPMQQWMKQVESMPLPAREKLLKTHAEIIEAINAHIVKWSPVAWLFLMVGWPIRLFAQLLKIRIKVVKSAEEIPAVLEQEALEQQEAFADCPAAVG